MGKLVKRLCVLLCVDETECDHYSLYVEGTPHTLLPEVSNTHITDSVYIHSAAILPYKNSCVILGVCTYLLLCVHLALVLH